MNKFEVIAFIRDQMLANPDIDASMAYSAAKLAQKDPIVYNLMNSWMESIDEFERTYIEVLIENELKEKNNG